MWIITHQTTDTINYLGLKKEYTVGRKNTDIVITGDESISRSHAKIICKEDGSLKLIDTKSKYGTYHNEEKLVHNIETDVTDGMIIKFGISRSLYRFNKIIINVATSNIHPNDKQQLIENINFLHGTYSTEWSVNCTHLTISVVKLTLKVLCALTLGQPIVNIKYWSDYVKCIQNNEKPPGTGKYLPTITESLLSRKVPLVYDPRRKKLFINKMFVFLMENTMKSTEQAIIAAGGKAVLWKHSNIHLDWLSSESPEYIFIEEYTKNIVRDEYHKTFYDAVLHLKKIGKRSIPLQEIALAILYCTCEKDCNPNFNRVENLISVKPQSQGNSKILAPETQNLSQESFKKSEDIVLSESIRGSMNFDSQYSIPLSENLNSRSKTMEKIINNHDNKNKNINEKNLEECTTKDLLDQHKKQLEKVDKFFETIDNEGHASKINENNISEINKNKRTLDNYDDNNPPKKPKQDMEKQKTNPFILARKRNNLQNENLDTSHTSMKTTKSLTKTTSENPFMSKKRKTEVEIERSNKKSSFIDISNNKKNEISDNILSSTLINPNISPPKFNPNITIISTGWISKSSNKTMNNDQTTNTIKIKKELLDEDKLLWIESMRDKIIVLFEDLEIQSVKMKKNISVNSTNSNKNFKKFKKVLPKSSQSYIVPSNQYQTIICGRELIENRLESDDEYISDNEFNDANMKNVMKITKNTSKTTNPFNSIINTTTSSNKRKFNFLDNFKKK